MQHLLAELYPPQMIFKVYLKMSPSARLCSVISLTSNKVPKILLSYDTLVFLLILCYPSFDKFNLSDFLPPEAKSKISECVINIILKKNINFHDLTPSIHY